MYEYDDAGRMVSSHPEVEWDATERAWMLALEQYRRDILCPCGCGFPVDVALDPDTEFKLGDPIRVRCWVRTRLAISQAEYAKSEGARPEGLLWSVQLKKT